MTTPLNSRTRAALDDFDRRLADEGIDVRIYVSNGIVMALVFDSDEDTVDFGAAANRGDELLATIGADIARQHGLPPHWLHQSTPGDPPKPLRPAAESKTGSEPSSPGGADAERSEISP